jgi:DNA modification methylase
LTKSSRGLQPLGDLKVVVRSLSSLKPNPRNARTHSRRQIDQIAESIRTFGFNNPVLIDEDAMIIAGHGRLEAAKRLGMTEVPTVCLSHMTEAQKRAYILADNRLAEKAGWDEEILAIEFQALFETAPELDLTITGFEIAEIDLIIGDYEDGPEPDSLDDLPDVTPQTPVVTRRGDLWQLGRHRVLCADATSADSYATLLNGETVQMTFTDPPYNVPIGGHVSGLGKVQHPEFVMASGEMSEAEFSGFLTMILKNVASVSADGAIAFVCMDWRHLYELFGAARTAGLTQKNVCVWVKTNAGMGTFYRSQHEMIAVFKVGTAPHINSFELGQYGRRRTNVWTYPGVNSFGEGRDDALAMHPTVKPVRLVADAIKDCSKRNGLILDPFLGSGTTLIAAETTGRRCVGLELDPRYVDTIVRRWEQVTGDTAILSATGQSFAAVAAARVATSEEVAHGS